MWGDNYNGQLGDGTTTHRSSPVQTVAGGNTWSHVACGYGHTAAVKTDGTLWTWGSDNYGQLGDYQTITPLIAPSAPAGSVVTGGGALSAGPHFARIVAVNTTGATTDAGFEFPALLSTTATGTFPGSLTYDSTQNVIWVTNRNATGAVQQFDATTGAHIGTDVTDASIISPYKIIHDTTQNAIWVTSGGATPNLIKIDAATSTFIAAYATTGTVPGGMAFDVTHNVIWVLDVLANTLQQYNAATGAHIGVDSTTGLNPLAVAYDITQNVVWVACQNYNNLQKFDAATGAFIAEYPTLANSWDVTYDLTQNAVWVLAQSGAIQKYDAATGTLIGTYSTLAGEFIKFDSTQNAIWVGTIYSTLQKFDAATGAKVGPDIPTSTAGLTGIAYDPTQNAIWSVNSNSVPNNILQKFDATTFAGIPTASGDSIDWAWPAVTDAVSYQIWVGTTSGMVEHLVPFLP
jgi:DNA-binding beta-propeller fold protein YncE